jgi:hypothetical protein
MAFSGEIGMVIHGSRELPPFSEPATCWLIEIQPDHEDAVRRIFDGLPISLIGETISEPRFRYAERFDYPLGELKAAWQSRSH